MISRAAATNAVSFRTFVGKLTVDHQLAFEEDTLGRCIVELDTTAGEPFGDLRGYDFAAFAVLMPQPGEARDRPGTPGNERKAQNAVLVA